MIRRALINIIVAIIIPIMTTACFTGIESTPKITAESVKGRGAKAPVEQTISAKIIGEPPGEWKKGKRWLVSDAKIYLALTSASDSASPLPGDTLELVDVRPIPTLTGHEAAELVLAGSDGRLFFHRTGIQFDEWTNKSVYNIPFAIELSAIEKAHEEIVGKTFFISTPRWTDHDGNDIVGQRHIPVKIENVIPGNYLYPLKIEFSQPNRPEQPLRYILLTYGTETAANRNFDIVFTSENPRKRYPNITDDNWQKIINSQIAEGMTRDECRLALGAPASVDRAYTAGLQLERWTYENGVYLLFEDGYLTRFRM